MRLGGVGFPAHTFDDGPLNEPQQPTSCRRLAAERPICWADERARGDLGINVSCNARTTSETRSSARGAILLRKGDIYRLVAHVEPSRIPEEVPEKLDRLAGLFDASKPGEEA